MISAISASELASRLAARAHEVCRHYLRAGHKEGRYWLIGDTLGAPVRSLYVRLTGPESGKGAAGKWTDAATAEHGDLLDLIRLNRGFSSVRESMDEARAFLSLPLPEVPAPSDNRRKPAPHGSSESARRLFAMSKPISGTFAEIYLRKRGIDPAIADVRALRFHPRCYYRDGDDASLRTFPALIAAVTDNESQITGVHRTWLDPYGAVEKAPISSPRRAMGNLLGSGVR